MEVSPYGQENKMIQAIGFTPQIHSQKYKQLQKSDYDLSKNSNPSFGINWRKGVVKYGCIPSIVTVGAGVAGLLYGFGSFYNESGAIVRKIIENRYEFPKVVGIGLVVGLVSLFLLSLCKGKKH